jgi:hypothetical protein
VRHIYFEDQNSDSFPLTYSEKKRNSVLTDEEHQTLFLASVQKIIQFYKNFVFTCAYLEDTSHKNSVKVYMRLFKSSGDWYIGYTTKASVYLRHYDDKIECINLIERKAPMSSLFDRYMKTIHLEDDVTILTIAEVHDKDTAKILEKKLIQHFSKDNGLPIELCLNTYFT